jgi:hypothetical protein
MSIGIDYEIDKITTKLNANLFTAVVGNTYTAYGRAYVNSHNGESIPEVNTASSKEYVDKLLNDTVNGISFFVVENNYSPRGDGRSFEAVVSLFFAVNTDILYPAVTERATEYLVRDVINELVRSKFKMSDQSDAVTIGLDAFSDFDIVKEGDDMRPFLLARFRGLMNFQYNNC